MSQLLFMSLVPITDVNVSPGEPSDAPVSLPAAVCMGVARGRCEVRVYPREKAVETATGRQSGATLERAQIFSSGMNREVTEREKALIIAETGLPAERISIIDVVDSDGPGNSVQIHARCGGLPVVFSADAVFSNEAGDYIFDEEDFRTEMHLRLEEVKRFLSSGTPPAWLLREAAVFALVRGDTAPPMYDGYEKFTAPLAALL